ncbi:hypothetical protein JCGZ_03169 [Jatropha curcas]|uniref:Uncharacterized protein n=1 Tax=Jatropha curcas TaxID=180498 RepID=A0A067L1E4_JATCU|nr:hypothetical protein JCGZ_03169 [Jatropha curcas]
MNSSMKFELDIVKSARFWEAMTSRPQWTAAVMAVWRLAEETAARPLKAKICNSDTEPESKV